MKLVHANFSSGGIGVYGKAIEKALGNWKHDEVEVTNILIPLGFKLRLSYIQKIFMITLTLSRLKPDCVYDSCGKSNFIPFALLFLLSKTVGFRLVAVDHDPTAHSGMRSGMFKQWFCKFILKRMHEVVVHGPWCSDQLVKVTGRRGTIIPHINLHLFEENGNPRFSPRSEGHRVRILFFGALRPNKGVEILPEYLRRLNEVAPHAELIVAGSKKLASSLNRSNWPLQLDQILLDLNKNGAKVIDQYVSDKEVSELIRNCDVLLLPYKDATQSGVLSLAVSFGKPVVATDVGDLGMTVKAYNLGAVSDYDPVTLADVTQNVLSNKGAYAASIQQYAENIISDKEISSRIYEVAQS